MGIVSGERSARLVSAAPRERDGPASERLREDYPGAEQFFPARRTLERLRQAALECRGCPLYRAATATVFGAGSSGASILLVGEQPGDAEDRAGAPFVGPAGRVLDTALERAGIPRDSTYVTNVVKHFKWTPRGKRRLHKTPNVWEIGACLPWLEQEIAQVRPNVLVALGATAAQALFGRDFRVTRQRGQPLETPLAPRALATIHPSAILRQRSSAARADELDRFVEDLGAAARLASAG